MAIIVLTSSASNKQYHHRPQVTVASVYSGGWHEIHRDKLDMYVDILKNLSKGSKITHIRNTAKTTTPKLTKYYVGTLCRFGLVTEIAVTKKNRTKSKKTGKHNIRTVRRYYITPKGHEFIRIYDNIVELLTTFPSSVCS